MFVSSQYVIPFFTLARMRGVVYNTLFSSRNLEIRKCQSMIRVFFLFNVLLHRKNYNKDATPERLDDNSVYVMHLYVVSCDDWTLKIGETLYIWHLTF